MTRILALDAGTTRSAWVLVDDGMPVRWGWDTNQYVRGTAEFYAIDPDQVVIEDITHYGKDIAVGKDVFETLKWMGRFDPDCTATFIPRPEIKLYLCGSPRATDTNIRQAIIDRFGGQEKAIGGKKCQGRGCHGRGVIRCSKCNGGSKKKWQCDQCGNFDGEPGPSTAGFNVCPVCNGTGYQTPPGPLHAFSRSGMGSHGWSALAVALTYLGRKEVAR